MKIRFLCNQQRLVTGKFNFEKIKIKGENKLLIKHNHFQIPFVHMLNYIHN